jgi:hypothetical protein
MLTGRPWFHYIGLINAICYCHQVLHPMYRGGAIRPKPRPRPQYECWYGRHTMHGGHNKIIFIILFIHLFIYRI